MPGRQEHNLILQNLSRGLLEGHTASLTPQQLDLAVKYYNNEFAYLGGVAIQHQLLRDAGISQLAVEAINILWNHVNHAPHAPGTNKKITQAELDEVATGAPAAIKRAISSAASRNMGATNNSKRLNPLEHHAVMQFLREKTEADGYINLNGQLQKSAVPPHQVTAIANSDLADLLTRNFTAPQRQNVLDNLWHAHKASRASAWDFSAATGISAAEFQAIMPVETAVEKKGNSPEEMAALQHNAKKAFAKGVLAVCGGADETKDPKAVFNLAAGAIIPLGAGGHAAPAHGSLGDFFKQPLLDHLQTLAAHDAAGGVAANAGLIIAANGALDANVLVGGLAVATAGAAITGLRTESTRLATESIGVGAPPSLKAKAIASAVANTMVVAAGLALGGANQAGNVSASADARAFIARQIITALKDPANGIAGAAAGQLSNQEVLEHAYGAMLQFNADNGFHADFQIAAADAQIAVNTVRANAGGIVGGLGGAVDLNNALGYNALNLGQIQEKHNQYAIATGVGLGATSSLSRANLKTTASSQVEAGLADTVPTALQSLAAGIQVADSHPARAGDSLTFARLPGSPIPPGGTPYTSLNIDLNNSRKKGAENTVWFYEDVVHENIVSHLGGDYSKLPEALALLSKAVTEKQKDKGGKAPDLSSLPPELQAGIQDAADKIDGFLKHKPVNVRGAAFCLRSKQDSTIAKSIFDVAVMPQLIARSSEHEKTKESINAAARDVVEKFRILELERVRQSKESLQLIIDKKGGEKSLSQKLNPFEKITNPFLKSAAMFAATILMGALVCLLLAAIVASGGAVAPIVFAGVMKGAFILASMAALYPPVAAMGKEIFGADSDTVGKKAMSKIRELTRKEKALEKETPQNLTPKELASTISNINTPKYNTGNKGVVTTYSTEMITGRLKTGAKTDQNAQELASEADASKQELQRLITAHPEIANPLRAGSSPLPNARTPAIPAGAGAAVTKQQETFQSMVTEAKNVADRHRDV